MGQIPLLGGAYTARSIIANAQRCVNLYPESNSQGSQYPMTHYPTAGLVSLGDPPVPGIGRCLYTSSAGKLYYVCGGNVYYVDENWTFTLLGTMNNFTTPASMKDNGNTIALVDGSTSGYFINMTTNVMNQIADGNYLGASRVDYLDTFLLFNQPETRNFYSTLSNVTTFDPLYIAGKAGYPDKLQTLIVVHREIWLLGEQTSEVWFNAGAAPFPFAIIGGVFIQHGCAAKYSVASHGLETFWLSKDKDGKAIVLMGQSYNAVRISTFAIEDEFQNYAKIDDAIGMTWQIGGHIFYVLTFPTADKTWVFDKGEGLWHELAWTDDDGKEHRHRANCAAFAYNTNVVADWQTGRLYKLDLNTYMDDGRPVVRRRGFPTLGNESKRIQYMGFLADFEVGRGSEAFGGEFNDDFNDDFSIGGDPSGGVAVSLRWSDTRGASWGNPLRQGIGASGEYSTIPQWSRLGIGRNRVFELFWSSSAKTALNGANVQGQVLAS